MLPQFAHFLDNFFRNEEDIKVVKKPSVSVCCLFVYKEVNMRICTHGGVCPKWADPFGRTPTMHTSKNKNQREIKKKKSFAKVGQPYRAGSPRKVQDEWILNARRYVE